MRLDPAEALFDTFADALADGVAAVARRAPVDGCLARLAQLAERAVDCDMRRARAATRPPRRGIKNVSRRFSPIRGEVFDRETVPDGR